MSEKDVNYKPGELVTAWMSGRYGGGNETCCRHFSDERQ